MKRNDQITQHIEKRDIKLDCKLIDLRDAGRISETLYGLCQDDSFFTKVRDTVWFMLNHDERYSFSRNYAYTDLGCKEPNSWQTKLYHNDLLYMVAIARAFGLREPYFHDSILLAPGEKLMMI